MWYVQLLLLFSIISVLLRAEAQEVQRLTNTVGGSGTNEHFAASWTSTMTLQFTPEHNMKNNGTRDLVQLFKYTL